MDNFELDVPYETIRMASGMAIGVGKSGYRSRQVRLHLRRAQRRSTRYRNVLRKIRAEGT